MRLSPEQTLARLYYLKLIGETYTSPLAPRPTTTPLTGSLDDLKKRVESCHLCDLAKTRQKSVFGGGHPQASLMFIGEIPAPSDDQSGVPFVGRSGELLTKMIEGVFGLSRSDVYITTAIKCAPPMNRIATPQECQMCQPYLEAQIQAIRPKVIVTLGMLPLQALLPHTTNITKERGKVHPYHDASIIATYHPSFLLKNPSIKPDVYADLLLAKSLIDPVLRHDG